MAPKTKQTKPAEVVVDLKPNSDSESEIEIEIPKIEKHKKAMTKAKPKAKKTEPKEESDAESEKSESEPKEKKKAKRVVNGCVPLDLVKQVMKHDEFPEGAINQTKVKTILDLFVKTIVENVKNGDNVTLTNYMTFKRMQHAERVHKIPKTDNTVTKPAHMVMTIDIKPALKKEFEAIPVSE